jgi:hypothetical protein
VEICTVQFRRSQAESPGPIQEWQRHITSQARDMAKAVPRT